MIRADIHVHTDYFHAKNNVKDMYISAMAKGLEYFGFSEHSPLPDGFSCLLYREGDLHQAFDDYVRDVLALKKEVSEKKGEEPYPKILLGVELDFTPTHAHWMDYIIEKYPFDYIIGTVHFVGNENIGLWGHEEVSLEKKFNFFEQYYHTLAELAKWGKADIVAHPDFVKIFCIDDFNAWLNRKSSLQCIENALLAIKDSGMALEVSTGGLNKKCKQIHPSPQIMELVAKHALEISFGSDTHNINTVAYAFDDLAAFAASYGYKRHVIFENRQKIYLDF